MSLKSASRYKKIIADTGLFIAFRPVVGGAKHGEVANIRCAAIAPCGNMVCVHFFQLIDTLLVVVAAKGAKRAV